MVPAKFDKLKETLFYCASPSGFFAPRGERKWIFGVHDEGKDRQYFEVVPHQQSINKLLKAGLIEWHLVDDEEVKGKVFRLTERGKIAAMEIALHVDEVLSRVEKAAKPSIILPN